MILACQTVYDSEHHCRGYSIVTYHGRRCKYVFRDMMSCSFVDTVGSRHSVTFQKMVICVILVIDQLNAQILVL